MEWRRVDFPEPFSPVNMTSGCERSTIIGMWKLRFVNTGWARIFRYIKTQDSRASTGILKGWRPSFESDRTRVSLFLQPAFLGRAVAGDADRAEPDASRDGGDDAESAPEGCRGGCTARRAHRPHLRRSATTARDFAARFAPRGLSDGGHRGSLRRPDR